MAEDGDAGGGDADPTLADMLGEDPIVKPELAEEPVEKVEPIVPATPPPATVDHTAMSKAFAASLKEAFPQATPTAPPITEAEAKKILKVWEPTPEWQAKFDNLETRGAALTDLRNGMALQMDTVTQFRLQELQQQFNQSVAPIQQYILAQESNARESRFNETFKDVGTPELKPLRDAIVTSLATAGQFNGKTEADAFKLIATTMESVIQTHKPDFKLSAGGAPAPSGATKQPTNGNALRPSTGGASGGGGGKPAGDDNKSKSKVVALLDAR